MTEAPASVEPYEPPLRPFDQGREEDYRLWRKWKLSSYPRSIDELPVPVGNPRCLTKDEHREILKRCINTNAAIYEVSGADVTDKEALRAMGEQFGLTRLDANLRSDEDSITSLRVVPGDHATHYIPYTNRPLNWHTDGYYNTPQEQVRGILMHCVSGAAEGGENVFLDHEIAYILMRDENPDYIKAFMQPDVMVIPANVEEGRQLRPEQAGPVYSVDAATGALHMRYTARTHSIVWKKDRNTRLAAGFLTELLTGSSDYTLRHRLSAGQGIICNNILHKREAFSDEPETGQTRLLYRARYHERIRGTDMAVVETGVRTCSG